MEDAYYGDFCAVVDSAATVVSVSANWAHGPYRHIEVGTLATDGLPPDATQALRTVLIDEATAASPPEPTAGYRWRVVSLGTGGALVSFTPVSYSEETPSPIIASIPGAVYEFWIDPQGEMHVRQMSGGFSKLLDLPPQVPLTFAQIISMISPDELPGLMDSIAQSQQRHIDWEYTFSVTTAKGQQRWVLGKARIQSVEPDGTCRWYGQALDITEHQRTKQLLADTSRHTRLGGWEYYPKTDSLQWTLETFRIYDIDPANTPTVSDAYRVVHPDYYARFVEAVQNYVDEGTLYDMQMSITTRAGNHRWIRARSFEREVVDGKVVRIQGTVQDLTEQHRYQRAVRTLTQDTALLKGQQLFKAIAECLHRQFNYAEVVIGKFVDGQFDHLTPRAAWRDGRFVDLAPYPVAGTPEAQLFRNEILLLKSGVQQRFPEDDRLRAWQTTSYLGVLVHNAQREPIGLIALYDPAPREADSVLINLIRLFAYRVGAEMEHARQERMLRESRASLKAIFEATVQYYLVFDEAGRLVRFNDSVSDLLGSDGPPPEVGRRASDYPTLNQIADFEESFQRALAGERHVVGVSLMLPNVGRRWFEVAYAPVQDKQVGHRITCALLDVTEQRQAERRSASLGQMLAESRNEIYCFDPTTYELLYANQAAARSLGYELPELLQRSYLQVQADHVRNCCLHQMQQSSNEPLNCTSYHQRQDGTTYPVEVFLQFSHYDDRPVVLAVALDVTRRERAEQQSQRLNAELLAKNNRLEHFAHVASHQLRAPVAHILGLTGLLDANGPVGEELPQTLHYLRRASQQLDDIVHQLVHSLDSQRHHQTKREVVSLSGAMPVVLRALRDALASAGAQVTYSFEEVDRLQTTPAFLYSALYQLINASLYQQHWPLSVSVGATHAGEHVRVSVVSRPLSREKGMHLPHEVAPLEEDVSALQLQTEALGGNLLTERTVDGQQSFHLLLPRVLEAVTTNQ